MYALHYACGNQASRDVIRLLLVNFPDAAKLPDPRGMLPIHYLACWGPSSVAVVDMLLVAHRDVASARDDEGNTPLDLAKDGDYPERVAVMAALKKWLADKPSASKSNNNSRALTIHAHDEEEKKDCDDDDSFRVDALESQVRKLQTELQRKARGGNNNTAEESDTLSLQRKIRQLQGELELKEAEESHAHGYDDANSWKGNEEAHIWRKKFIALEKRYEEREHELLVENGKLMDDVHRAEKNLALAEESLDHRNRTTAEKDARIAELEKQIENSKAERDGLRMSLGDLMDKHDTFKKKSINLSDRLGSLSVSLESMMEQQAALTVAMKERNEQYQDVIRQRRTKLNELEELEAGMQKDETNLEKSLDKQMKEMEAIAAVIAATRN
jgi:chromosome segregation ATPase